MFQIVSNILVCSYHTGVTMNSVSFFFFLNQNCACLNDNFYDLLIIECHHGNLKKKTSLDCYSLSKRLGQSQRAW